MPGLFFYAFFCKSHGVLFFFARILLKDKNTFHIPCPSSTFAKYMSLFKRFVLSVPDWLSNAVKKD